ncbi:DUF3047 domain-containing protein [Methylomicrobium sp. Wu6]|uniref:DUF3047 domain-containing protein n=1 Tax=Methylomicrobium sp. Wu6 TaxID=3107928 RepID=UPI002DD66497|nr:DUF3047 domain-containing protein [Methylomicrobium sp. Wu6]MEC4747217.1 DUF3047 domain-containing protein [Methylomicrobium sp. Wu6]
MFRTFSSESIALLLFLTMTSNIAQGADKVGIGDFSSGSLRDWETQSFKGQTQYRLVEQNGMKVLKADSIASASGLFRKQRIDLTKTPFLNWRWRIENRLGKLNEQSKPGDDYAARVYVVIESGLAFWRKKALNYVWASTSPKGRIWPNAFAGEHVMMLALRSSSDDVATWYDEKRNILDDLRKQFGEDIRFIDAVAIMTDTDNAGGRATAYYGDIFFSAN